MSTKQPATNSSSPMKQMSPPSGMFVIIFFVTKQRHSVYFKLRKTLNTRFVGNFTSSMTICWEFHYNDVSVRSFININPLKQSGFRWLHFKCSVSSRSNLPFSISDIRALWRSVLSARVPEYQKLKMYVRPGWH